MKINTYFAKINFVSHIFDVYDSKIELNSVLSNLAKSLNEELKYTRSDLKIKKEGKDINYEAEYYLRSLNRIASEGNYLAGYLHKDFLVYYNQYDDDSKKIIKKAVESTEIVTFMIDLDCEKICFHATNRFGYDEIINAFENIFNIATEKYKYIFEVHLIRGELSLDNLKEDLKKIGKIEEIKITIKTPNPDDPVLREIKAKRGGVVIDKLKSSKVTQKSILLNSKAPEGIDINSPEVNDELDVVDNIHGFIKFEEANKNGYAEIEAIGNGQRYTSKGVKPLTMKIDEAQKGLGLFIEKAKTLIKQI